MQNLCIICLKSTPDLKSVIEIDKNDVKIIINLRKCVPEVEWQNDFQICLSCQQQLENVCAFKEQCIKSYQSRKKSADVKLEAPNIDDFCNNASDSEEIEEARQNFVCFHCNKGFKLKNVLANHIRYEHDKVRKKTKSLAVTSFGEKKEKIEVTPDLDVKFEEKDLKPFNICDICGTSFSNKYLLKRHTRNVHATEKKFKCELCDRKFASPVYLNAHKRYHSGERKHICSFCGKGYITASDLYHHEKIHANKRAYRCELCPKAFNTSSDLHKHKICVHLDRTQWKYECSFCQRRFPLKTNLDTHTKTHTGERNFLCHLCDRKCINRSVLKRHIESHSIVKSYKCNVCLQAYKYQKSLDLHLAKTHGIGDIKIPERVKKYFCNLCPKSYFANNKLQKHIRSHTGERPFHCPACDKSFIDKSYIKQHLKTAHGALDFTN